MDAFVAKEFRWWQSKRTSDLSILLKYMLIIWWCLSYQVKKGELSWNAIGWVVRNENWLQHHREYWGRHVQLTDSPGVISVYYPDVVTWREPFVRCIHRYSSLVPVRSHFPRFCSGGVRRTFGGKEGAPTISQMGCWRLQVRFRPSVDFFDVNATVYRRRAEVSKICKTFFLRSRGPMLNNSATSGPWAKVGLR